MRIVPAARLTLAVLIVASTLTLCGARPAIDPTWSSELSGQVVDVITTASDTWTSLGARYGIDAGVLAQLNARRLQDRLVSGSSVRIDSRHIVPVTAPDVALAINVPQRMLFARGAAGTLAFPVAAGSAGWPTPIADFTIVAKETNPTWDVPLSIQQEMRAQGRRVVERVPPGPANPLGAHWIGLSLGSVGIHGTNAPASIFRHATHGCIRLHPEDVARLYPAVDVGARGRTIYEPLLLAVTPDGIFVEAHPDVYRRGPADRLAWLRQRATPTLTEAIDWESAARVVDAREGIARRIGRARPMTITARHD